jgi:hypothetical protein
MPAVVELTPLTLRGGNLLDQLEIKTGLAPVETSQSSGAKKYYLAGAANIDRFEAALERIEPNWVRHLILKDVTPAE